MKRLFPMILLITFLLVGCAAEPAPVATEPAGQLQLANPWKGYDSLTDAETASALDFPLPETITEACAAEVFRVMNGSLLEVTYKDGDSEITVRMQSGEDQDISGVYADFTSVETTVHNGASVTEKQADDCCVYLIHKDGYSFSIYASSAVDPALCSEILAYIC